MIYSSLCSSIIRCHENKEILDNILLLFREKKDRDSECIYLYILYFESI
jgi:hypothetical protein